MKNKGKRQEAIIELLTSEEIGSQDELLHKLLEKGYDLTQATLSRDLKELKVIKAPGTEGKYVYVIQQDKKAGLQAGDQFAVSGFVSIEFSGNLAVMKTKPGFANGIASVIDRYAPQTLIGTIAGDDSILMVMKEGVTKVNVMHELSTLIPGVI